MVNKEEAKGNGEGGGARKGREEGRERKQWGATMTCPIPSISSPPPQINLRNNNQLTIATQEEATGDIEASEGSKGIGGGEGREHEQWSTTMRRCIDRVAPLPARPKN